MTKLIIKLKGQVTNEIILDPQKVWLAGRKPDADIRLEGEKGISREHFRISEENGRWNLEVLSKLGNVTMNDALITSAALSPGFIFKLPPYEFEIATVETSLKVENGQSQVFENFQSNDGSMGDRTVVQKSELAAYVKFINDDGDVQQKIKLEGGDTWTAGRDVNAQVMISDHRVSRRQFEIRKTSLGYEIADLGSVNGTYINEKVLESGDSVVLKSGDVIRVLDHKLIFEILDPNFFDRIENLPAIADPIIEESPPEYLPMDSSPQPIEPPPIDPFPQPGYATAPAEDAVAARTKKIRFILIIAIVVIGAFFLFQKPKEDTDTLSNAIPSGADPLSALTPQQKSEYKQSLELAKRYHMEGNYALALSEAEELGKKFNVKDPELERVKNTAQAAIESQKLLIRQEKEAKEKQDMENRIQTVADRCGKNLEQFSREEDLDNCLVDALQLNPTHPAIVEVKTRMQGILADREARRQKRAEYDKKVAAMHALYEQAQKIEKEGDYLKTIAGYKKVIGSSLPDPNNYRGTSEKHLSQLKIEMDNKVKTYQKEAADHKKKQELKQAIQVLRSAIKIDPTREDLKDQVEEIKNELRKQMMVYYQEGVLEESFGNVEGGDNRAGAKDKWKKIIELDVTDGEYYQKAFIKLKKYGAN
jgi:pSer/pThr/pTyr-binding forkhead associated (FHA) protein/tetratricopeptide (TPR) repeat protein